MPTYVSVIVPNLHSPVVGRTVDSLRLQDSPAPLEILVVGQDRFGLVREDEQVRFLETARPVNPAVARNIGIRAAGGDMLAFTDADCVAAPDWLSRLISHYEDPAVTVVGGGVDFPADNYWTLCDNVATFHEYLPYTRPGTRDVLPTINLSLRASILSRIGLFDERRVAGEDADLSMRLRLQGHLLHFEPRAVVTHYPQRHSPSAILRHAHTFGRYSIKVDRQYQDLLGVPKLVRRWWAMLLSSPVLSAEVVRRSLFVDGLRPAHWKTLPVVYVAKIAWCLGATQTLRRGSALE